METGSIAEDQRARRPFENHELRSWNLPLHFSVGRIRCSEWISPREHVFVGASALAAREVLHCASVRVHLTEIEKGADFPAVLGVSMPALGSKPCIRIQGHRIPHVEVDQLGPHAQVRIGHVQDQRVEVEIQQRITGRDERLSVLRIFKNDVMLDGPKIVLLSKILLPLPGDRLNLIARAEL